MANISTKAIGLDISTSVVRAADIKKGRKGYELVGYSEEKIPVSALVAGVIRQPDNVKAAVEKVLSNLKFSKSDHIYAVCTIPDDKVYMQEAEFPKLDIKKLEEAIQFKIQSFIPLPLTEVYWDFLILHENPNQTYSVLISAASKETVDSFYSVIKSAGIIPIRFESSSMSALRTISIEQNGALLIDAGKTQTTLSVVQDGAVKFTSTVHMGINQLIKAYDDFFMIDDDKSIQILNETGVDLKNEAMTKKLEEIFMPLSQEVEKTIHYQNKLDIKDIYVFGEGSGIKGLNHFISTNENISIHSIQNPLTSFPANFDISKGVNVVGAALKNFQKKEDNSINFMPPTAQKQIISDIIIRRAFKLLRVISINLAAYSVIFILFGIFLQQMQVYNQQKLQIVENNITLKNYPEQSNIITGYNTDLQKLSAAQSAFIDWTGLLKEIPTLTPQGVTLSAFNVTKSQQGWNVSISGNAATRQDLLTYAKNLETQSKYLKGVVLPIQYIQSDTNLAFTINATITKLN